jgi:hypothetical protein
LEPPPASTLSPIKTVKPRVAVPARQKPATLVKIREPKKIKPMVEVSINDKEQVRPLPPPSSSSPRTLQTTDLERLSRLTCSREFSYFHKEIKCEIKTNEHQLAFFQTKLYHLKNEFINQNSEQFNLEQIRKYFIEALQKNIDRRIKPDEFITLADKLKQDIKQVKLKILEKFYFLFFFCIKAIDKWLKRKEPGKQNRALSEYSQKRQSRIRELIKETLEETKKQQENSEESPMDISQDQSQEEVQCID